MDRRQGWWLVCGFLVAPLVAALTSVLVSVFADSNHGEITDLLVAVSLVYAFSAPAILLIGIPSLALAHRFNLVRWWVALLFGLLSGALYRIAIQFNQLDMAWFNEYGLELLKFAIIGAAPALFVWWCWRMAYSLRPLLLGT